MGSDSRHLVSSPSFTDFREAGTTFAGMQKVGSKVMVLGKDESGMWRIAQLLFWSQEGSMSLASIKLLFSGRALMDPCSGRAGSLGVPSCLGVSECCR